MPNLFISYRREDSSVWAGRLFDRLANELGKECVFRDIHTIRPGADFAMVIADHIARCDVLLAVIGPKWLTLETDKGLRRLDDPVDFVKTEIHTALKLGKLIIPCLVDSAPMPKLSELPSDLAPLANHNALIVSDSYFDYDINRLLQAIDPKYKTETPFRPRLGFLALVFYSLITTFLLTVIFLVTAEIVWNWHFDSSEISFITLTILGFMSWLFWMRARKR